jgi:copper chaperone CopZ
VTSTYQVSGMHCGSCIAKVTKALQPFASAVSVSLNPPQALLDGANAPIATLQAALSGVGKYGIVAVANTAANTAANTVVPELPVNSATWWKTYQPLLLIAAYILAASLLVQVGLQLGKDTGASALSSLSISETMRYFMAGFFLVFSFFKLLDVSAFANAYKGYDLLAARWPTWGYIYPFVELALGLAYLSNIAPMLTNWVTLIVMGFSAIGVIRAVVNKSQIQCACLGTVFKLPMSTVTIVEDVGMVLMAAMMIFIPT